MSPRCDDPHWQSVLDELQRTLTKAQFETWFSRARFVSGTGAEVRLFVPNRFYADWLGTHYRRVVEDVIERMLGFAPRLTIEIETAAAAAPVEPLAPSERGDTSDEVLGLHRKSRFETFVVGGCNRLSFEAAKAAAQSPGTDYNPLFIHGGVGLGKTHLLQSACREFARLHPGKRVVYVPADGFVAEFVRAVEQKAFEEFRGRYRSLSLLAIDDVQNLAGKERSQEEFFHAFNVLHERNCQIIIAADASPGEVRSLSERLTSRLGWGLAVQLESPDVDTRLAILRARVTTDKLRVSDEVLRLIAAAVPGSIRELEGTLVRVIGFASLSNRAVTTGLAEELLQISEVHHRRRIDVEDIQRVVAEHFDLGCRELLSRRRVHRIAYPRQLAMYLSRELTPDSLEEIGMRFGRRDHTTVLYACDKIERARREDPELAETIAALKRVLDGYE